MITILLEKILAALTTLLSNIKTKLTTIKNNLDDLIVVKTASGSIATFETDIEKPLISCNIEILPKQASGTPSPSNPLPISGTDTITVTDTGANQWDEQFTLTGINANTGSVGSWTDRLTSKNGIITKPSTSYYFVYPTAGTWYIHCYASDNTWLGTATTPNGLGYMTASGSFTTLANTAYIKFAAANNSYGTTYGNDISINYPSTDTAYHAHVTAQTQTVSLPSTVYGGEVDVIGGSGAADYGLITFDGSEDEDWKDYPTRNGFYISIADLKEGYAQDGYCNYIPVGTYLSVYNLRIGSNNNQIYATEITTTISGITDLATWRTYLSSHPLQVCYPLATPESLTLANPITITALDGVNNVFGDTDGNTTVQYLKKYKED